MADIHDPYGKVIGTKDDDGTGTPSGVDPEGAKRLEDMRGTGGLAELARKRKAERDAKKGAVDDLATKEAEKAAQSAATKIPRR